MIPYRIETLFQREPWANWALFGLTIAASLSIQAGLFPEEVVDGFFVWGQGRPASMLGYMFNHGGFAHLAGNMVFLWVFGNAVCATVGNWLYLALYLGFGVVAALVHAQVGGQPMVGASGAIAGVVGMAVALYPVNKVTLFYTIGFASRTGRVGLWLLAVYWTAWDVLGAVLALGPVAYWAHLAGTATGLATGLLLLAAGVVTLTEFDHGSLLDLVLDREPPHKRRAANEEARAELQRAARAMLATYAEPFSLSEKSGSEPARRRLALRRRPADLESAPAVPTMLPEPRPAPGASPGAAHDCAARPQSLLAPALAQPLERGLQNPAAQPGNAGPTPAQAWPADLPDVRYFYFDGAGRFGPMGRAEFLGRLSGTPDTSRWWFWAEGMSEWRSVSALAGQSEGARPSVAADGVGR